MPPNSRGPGKRVTLRQVADDLGLSPATVSLVLNRAPAASSIPTSTHERVFEAAERLGYKPNLLARSLRSQRSFSIGVLVPEISEGYTAGVLSGIEEHLLDEGYFYLVASHRSKADLRQEYLEMLRNRLVEGLIVVNTPLAGAPDLPTVAVSGHQRLEGVTNVVIDHDRAAALALGHLVELGHHEIAFFKGHAHSVDTEQRWEAILRTAADLGVEVVPERTLQLGSEAVKETFAPEEGYQEGYAYGQELLARGEKFTALFAFNDVSAIGAMRAFFDAGVEVPGDCSVVGFDDITGAAYQNPGLTTVRQPLREMGTVAGRVLLERLTGRDGHPAEITVEPDFMVRESTAPPRKSSRSARGTGRKR